MRAILTYHSIDNSGSAISISQDAFEQHVNWLASGRVRVLPLADLVSRADADQGHAVALTFDDGFDNFVTTAWPRLRAHGLPATLFVVTGHVGGTNAWGGRADPRIPTLPLATWDALARCQDEGVTVGAHTRTHPRLTALPAERVADEIEASRDAIHSRLGTLPQSFAYPYGVLSDPIAQAVGTRFDVACTTEHTPLRGDDDPHRLPRLDAYYFRRRGSLDQWGSPLFRCRIALRYGARKVRGAARRSRP